jgi:hypothetical protein
MRKIKHMGMELTEAEHEQWHREHSELSPEQHAALMRQMGTSEAEDKEWHEKNDNPALAIGSKPVNPFAVGGGFLEYCVKQGWLIRTGTGNRSKYFVTASGRVELAKFGIEL